MVAENPWAITMTGTDSRATGRYSRPLMLRALRLELHCLEHEVSLPSNRWRRNLPVPGNRDRGTCTKAAGSLAVGFGSGATSAAATGRPKVTASRHWRGHRFG